MSVARVRVVCAPYNYPSMPSLDAALIKAALSCHGIEAHVDCLDLELAARLGNERYLALRESLLGDAAFSHMMFPGNRGRLQETFASRGEGHALEEAVAQLGGYLESLTKRYAPLLCGGDVLLFHLYSRQLFGALCIARLLHDRFGARIWLSGYHCQGACGESLRRLFPFVEKIFGTNVVRSVVAELTDGEPAYPGHIDDLPTPDYSDFLATLREVQGRGAVSGQADGGLGPGGGAFTCNFWLQVPYSMGCWWDKCSFCTLNCQHEQFEPRSAGRIVRDYRELARTCGTTRLLANEFNTTKGWREVLGEVLSELPGLEGSIDLCFKVSELQGADDAAFLAKRRINILVGVESLSARVLEGLDKGCTVIEVLRFLKLMERHRVACFYNLMCRLPFETREDLEETRRVIGFIWHLLPPFDIEEFRLTRGSAMHRHPQDFGIASCGARKDVEARLLPEELLDDYVPFFLDHEPESPDAIAAFDEWKALIDEWGDVYYAHARGRRPKDSSLLVTRHVGDVFEIVDARPGGAGARRLTALERDIYEFCDQIRTFDEVMAAFGDAGEHEVEHALATFEKEKTMFKEGARYLSLAV